MKKTEVIKQLTINGSMTFRQIIMATNIEKAELEKAISELLIGDDIYEIVIGNEKYYEL